MRPQVPVLIARVRRSYTVLMLAATCFLAFSATAQTLPVGPAKLAADAALDAVRRGEIILVDIRTPEEWKETGIAEGAVAYDMRDKEFVQTLIDLRLAYPDRPIALICRTGNRSGNVWRVLSAQGFPGLADVAEGMAGGPNGTGWLKRGLPVYAGTPELIEARRREILN